MVFLSCGAERGTGPPRRVAGEAESLSRGALGRPALWAPPRYEGHRSVGTQAAPQAPILRSRVLGPRAECQRPGPGTQPGFGSQPPRRAVPQLVLEAAPLWFHELV